MRPSKLRFPERTAATTRSFSSTACEISSAKGPEFPMHVVHPYPTTSKLSFSRYGKSPEVSRYSVTTFEPGAKLVLTCGSTESPLSTALRAKSPAPTMTEGLLVFVQLVIAAITVEPCLMRASSPSRFTVTISPTSSGVVSSKPGWGAPPAVGSGSPSPVTPAASAGVSLAGYDSTSFDVWLSPVDLAPPSLPPYSLLAPL